MNILVLTAATRFGGALTIYRQFIHHLPEFVRGNHYYIFIDPSMDHPHIEGVTYIKDSQHSWLHRIWFDNFGIKKWIKDSKINPDLIISLQNTGVNLNCKQVIYLQQSLPFYNVKWNPLKKSERKMFFYRYFYPFFISHSNKANVQWAVQIPYMKRSFIQKFGGREDSIHVIFPDVENIDTSKIKSAVVDSSKYNFLFPAGPFPYKEHKTLVHAVSLLNKENPELVSKIKIYFTILHSDYPKLATLVKNEGLQNQFVFMGKIEHSKLLSMYKSMHAMLFPSTIESFGLPLFEAAKFGLPIIAADMGYSREVIENYEGVEFIKNGDYDLWSRKIENLCNQIKRYQPISSRDSDWPLFFTRLVYGE